MENNPEKYNKIPQRVVGQIWDSVTHYDQAIKGLSMGIFPNNAALRTVLAGSLWTFLTLQRRTMRNYVSSIEGFKNNKVTSPALIIGSKIDKIATKEFSEECINRWKNRGTDVNYKLFEDSEHVKHLQKYPEEYLKSIEEHWRKVKLI